MFCIGVEIINLDTTIGFDAFIDKHSHMIGSGSGGNIYKVPKTRGVLKRIPILTNANNIEFI